MFLGLPRLPTAPSFSQPKVTPMPFSAIVCHALPHSRNHGAASQCLLRAGTRSSVMPETSLGAATATELGRTQPCLPLFCTVPLVLVLLARQGQVGRMSPGRLWWGHVAATGQAPAVPDAADFQTFLLCTPSTTSAHNVIKRLKSLCVAASSKCSLRWGHGGTAGPEATVMQHPGKAGWG